MGAQRATATTGRVLGDDRMTVIRVSINSEKSIGQSETVFEPFFSIEVKGG